MGNSRELRLLNSVRQMKRQALANSMGKLLETGKSELILQGTSQVEDESLL